MQAVEFPVFETRKGWGSLPEIPPKPRLNGAPLNILLPGNYGLAG